MFFKRIVLLELRCFFPGFLLESLGTLALFCSIFYAFPLFINHLVVICCELNDISNGGQYL
jgi:hypothetical protein